jgi:hypothetical protein
MAVVRIPRCDGFSVVGPEGPIGVVEEAWLGERDQLAGLAVRLPNGLRGLLLADDVQAVLEDDGEVLVEPGRRLLELAVPRLERADGGHVAAHWETTGELIAPEPERRSLRRRRVRESLGVQVGRPEEPTRPLWQIVLLLYGSIALLAIVVIGLAFMAELIATGHTFA